MKIWLDASRSIPEGFDVWVKCPYACITILRTGAVKEISFDHDLGAALTGYDVATHVRSLAHYGEIQRLTWHVHSMDPVGAERIRQALQQADKYWTMREALRDNPEEP